MKDEVRLASGYLFPIPVILPVDSDPAIRLDQDVALRNAKNELLAVMTVEELHAWDLGEVAQKVFGSQDLRHPLVAEMHRWGRLYMSGRLQVLQLPSLNHLVQHGFVRAQTASDSNGVQELPSQPGSEHLEPNYRDDRMGSTTVEEVS